MIFSLIQDFADVLAAMPREHPRYRILHLLDEAIRRDVHFIDRHPTTLFQCLWNSCWWYDCPEAAGHYDRSHPIDQTVRDAGGQCLHAVLERFRSTKEHATPAFNWLRSLRPPRYGLGGAQRAMFVGHEHSVYALAVSADDRVVATGSGEHRVWGAVLIHDLESGEEVMRRQPARPRTVTRVERDGTRTPMQIREGAGRVTVVQFSNSGRRVAVGTSVGFVEILSVPDGDVLERIDTFENGTAGGWFAHLPCVTDLAYSPRDWLAVGLGDGRFIVFDGPLSTPRLAARVETRQSVTCLAWSPDGSRLAVGAWSGELEIWRPSDGVRAAEIRAHDNGVRDVVFSPDGFRLYSSGNDGRIRAWVADLNRCLWETEYAADPRSAAAGHSDSRWDFMWIENGGWGLQRSGARCMAISRDGQRLASGGHDGTVRVWDSSHGEELMRLLGHEDWVTGVAFLDGSGRLISTSCDRTTRVWEPTANFVLPVLSLSGVAVERAWFSESGREVFGRGRDADGRPMAFRMMDGVPDAPGRADWDPEIPDEEWARAVGQRGWLLSFGLTESQCDKADTREVAAWYPEALTAIRQSPSTANVWLGIHRGHLRVVRLEGPPETVAANRSLPEGWSFCRECGRTVGTDDREGPCATCGTPLGPTDETTDTCLTCRSPIPSSSWRFCIYCGARQWYCSQFYE